MNAGYPTERPNWFALLFRHRCPRCRDGAVFGGLVSMNVNCPVCGLVFEREAGYFLGAMYFSYALAVIVAAPMVVLGVVRGWPIDVIGWVTGALLLVVAPWLFRASRVIWLHFDQVFDER